MHQTPLRRFLPRLRTGVLHIALLLTLLLGLFPATGHAAAPPGPAAIINARATSANVILIVTPVLRVGDLLVLAATNLYGRERIRLLIILKLSATGGRTAAVGGLRADTVVRQIDLEATEEGTLDYTLDTTSLVAGEYVVELLANDPLEVQASATFTLNPALAPSPSPSPSSSPSPSPTAVPPMPTRTPTAPPATATAPPRTPTAAPPAPPSTGSGGTLPGLPNTGAGGSSPRPLIAWLLLSAGVISAIGGWFLRRRTRRA